MKHGRSRGCEAVFLVCVNAVILALLAIAADYAVGAWRPHLAQLGPLVSAPVPEEAPAGGFAVYNASAARNVPLREWPPGSTVRKATAPAAAFLDFGFEKAWYDLRIDPAGFIAPSSVHADPQLTIAFLGGSTTECHLMAEDARFPYLVGRTIERATGLRTNSLNAGVAGNTALHAVDLLLHKVTPASPQFAVLMEAVNDLSVLAHYGTYFVGGSRTVVVTPDDARPSRPALMVDGIKRAARAALPNLYALAAAARAQLDLSTARTDEFAAVRAAGGANAPSDARIRTLYRANVLAFIEIARANDIRPILMTQFNRLTQVLDDDIRRGFERFPPPLPYGRFAAIYATLNEEVRQIAAERGVPLVDLDRAIPKTPGNFYDAVHLTQAGSQLAEAEISRILLGEIAARAPVVR